VQGDNRKNDKRGRLSVKELRDIVQEGNAIYANMGNGLSKMSKILAQAESWYAEYQPLLVRCNLINSKPTPAGSLVQLPELKAATDAASWDVALDLEEAQGSSRRWPKKLRIGSSVLPSLRGECGKLGERN